MDDHAAGTDATFKLRGRLAQEVALTATQLRAAVAAGTVTHVEQSVTYNTGATATHRSYKASRTPPLVSG